MIGEPVPAAIRAHCALSRKLPAAAVVSLARASQATVSPSAQSTLADAYAALPDWDDAALPAFRAFAQETAEQWRVLRSLGWSISVQDSDPYPSAAEMRADAARRRIAVLSTATTGGHPVLTDRQNDIFRAVHDVVAHAATGRGFDRHGEEAAFRAHRALYSPLARRALVTETRAQNAYLISRGIFGPQRAALLPQRWAAIDALTPTVGELPAAHTDAVRRHN